jgi:tetratricopeptide (TPR) repeat protein
VTLKDIQVQALVVGQNALEIMLAGQGTIMNMLGTFHCTSRRAFFAYRAPHPNQDRELLERLPRAPLRFATREYLVSSRTDELNKIVNWIENSPADKRVFWLCGAAGMGKSTLSSHLRDFLRRASRLAAYFSFSRNDKKQEDPAFIIGTLARQLALVDQGMGRVICDAIRSPSLDEQFASQFQARVLNPLFAASFPLPMVVILDALDEYKDILQLLDVLVELVPKMPPNVKLFFTSRPESQIETRMHQLDAEELGLYRATYSVMEAFFLDRLSSVKGWQSKSPSLDQISRLADAAKGHFVWAATACTVIACPSNGFPDDIVEQILSPRPISPHSAEARLDSLYHGALSHAFPDGPNSRTSLENYRRVLGAILVVEVRLNASELQTLLGKSARVDAIVSDLRGLQTRMSSEPTSDCPVTPASERFHASFLDFIVNPERCTDGLLHNGDQFRIDLSRSHNYVTQACLQRMDNFFNSEQGKAALYASTPDGLRYAFDYWASHINGSEVISDDLQRAVMDFCGRNFVHWFRIQIQSIRGKGASDFIPGVDPDLDVPGRLNHFRVECQAHPEYIRDVRQLDMVISVQRVAIRLASDDHPRRDEFMVGMGYSLEIRFRQVGRMSDLDAALQFYREALVLSPRGHPRRRNTLKPMSNILILRFRLMGALQDSNEAVSLSQEALELASDSLQRYTSLCDLAFALYARYARNRDPQDLKDANTMTQEAGPLRKTSHPDHAFLVMEGYFLSADLDAHDLDKLTGVIDWFRERIKLTPATHPNQSVFLNHLAHALHARFKSTRQLCDLDEAIGSLREVLRFIPPTHPERSTSLNNLARALQTQFDCSGKLQALDEAIALRREALKYIPATDHDRSVALNTLACALRTRLDSTSHLGDSDEATALRRELKGLELQTGPAEHDQSHSTVDRTQNVEGFATESLTSAKHKAFRTTLQERLGDEYCGAERYRLEEDKNRGKHWKKWGPYISDRQWVRVSLFYRCLISLDQAQGNRA